MKLTVGGCILGFTTAYLTNINLGLSAMASHRLIRGVAGMQAHKHMGINAERMLSDGLDGGIEVGKWSEKS